MKIFRRMENSFINCFRDEKEMRKVKLDETNRGHTMIKLRDDVILYKEKKLEIDDKVVLKEGDKVNETKKEGKDMKIYELFKEINNNGKQKNTTGWIEKKKEKEDSQEPDYKGRMESLGFKRLELIQVNSIEIESKKENK